MSIKLYAPAGHFRANSILIAGELAGVPVELVQTEYSEIKTPEFLKKNPLGKIPVIETAEGPIFETTAILRYIARVSGKLYGASNYEAGLVDQYLDANTSELFPSLFTLIFPYFGFKQVEKEVLKAARTEASQLLKIIDERLKTSAFLAGPTVSIADIHLATVLVLAFRVGFSEEQRKPFKNVVEYFNRVATIPQFAKYWGKVHLSATEFEIPSEDKKENKKKDAAKAAAVGKAEHAEKKDAPKKEQAPKKEAPKKETAKPKEEEKPQEVEEEEKPVESAWNLYDYKTLYTNAKDKEEAIKNLVENYKPAEYCIYHIHYQKYEGEGTILFQFNNMKNGFIQRCEGARKKAFGTYSIYGDEPNLDISGVWLFHGAEIPQEMLDNPSFEYHDKKKLDITKPEDLQILRDYWTKVTDDESVVNGLTLRAFGSFK